MAIQDDKRMPKSRVTLRYRTEINGAPEDITLPLRILVAGNFSGYTEENRKVGESSSSSEHERLPLDKRSTLDASETQNVVMHGEEGERLERAARFNPVLRRLNIKHNGVAFDKIQDFSPRLILSKGAGDVRTMLKVRRLLTHFKANLSNNKAYRQVIGEALASNPDGVRKLEEAYKAFVQIGAAPQEPAASAKSKEENTEDNTGE